MFKNVASQKIILLAIDTATGVPKTGDAANLTAYVSKDDGSVTALGDTSATEIDATNAKGSYSFDLTQAETNADKLYFSGKSSTSGVIIVPLTVFTRPAGFGDLAIANNAVASNVTRFGGSAATTSGGRPEVNTSHWGGTAVASANVLIDGAITAAKIASDAITSAKVADGFLTAAKFASGAFDAVWSVATRLLTAGTNIVLAKGTGVTGFNDLSAAQVNAEADTALADYDPPTRAELTSDTNTILSKLLKYVQLIVRKDAAIGTDNATEKTAINADGGSGAGSFDQQTDSQEALRDNQQSAATAALNAYDPPTRTEATADKDEILSAIPDTTDIKGEVDQALVDIHLDHLLAATYDPGAKPGASDALLNELVENDGGVSRFTANALEEAPSGGGGGGDATQAKQDQIIALIGTPANTDLAGDLADIEGKVDDLESRLGVPSNLGSGATVAANLVDIESQTDDIGAAGAGLTAIPSVGSVTGAVGSVSGNVGGNVGGSVGSVAGNVGGSVVGSIGSLSAQAKADVNAEADQALADYDTPTRAEATADKDEILTAVDAVPTNAELATALAAADDAVLAAIAALNNLSAAQVTAAVPTATQNADALLKRDFSAVTGEASRSALNALRFLRNKWAIAGATLSVKKEDDSTDAWTGAVTQTAGNPVSEIDPA